MTSSYVPVIDISPYAVGGADARAEVAASVDRAFSEVGFLILSGHGVRQSVIDRAYRQALDFFDLPEEEKKRYAPQELNVFRGYNGSKTQRSAGLLDAEAAADLRENYMMSRLDVEGDYYRRPEFFNTYAPNIWPERPEGYREAWEGLYREMEALSFRFIRICAAALSLPEDWFIDKVDKHSSTCVANHYPQQPTEPLPGQIRASAHADVGTITLLLTDQARGGLQVLGKDDTWHDVITAPGQIVVNVGDLLGRWTNDRWKSTKHRVVNPPREFATTRRLSMSFFQHPNFDAPVEAIPTCVAPGEAPKYPPLLAGEQIHRRMMRARIGFEVDVESQVPEHAGEGAAINAAALAR